MVLSVIIVAYRSRGEIAACLRSLPRALKGEELEIILVDNYPADGIEILIQKEFPWVRYIQPSVNLGFGRANNLGYASASSRFILFLNPDTISNVSALEHCLQRLRDDASIGLISPQLVLPDGAMDLACRRSIPSLWDGFCRASGLAAMFPHSDRFTGYNLTHLPAGGTYEVGAINGAFMMAPRTVLQAVAPDGKIFDENFFMYGDDLDLCIRVAGSGRRIVYDGSVQIVHLKGTSVSKEYEKMSTAIFDANRDVYLKHFNPQGSVWVKWKWRAAFGVWKTIAGAKARMRGYRGVKPL